MTARVWRLGLDDQPWAYAVEFPYSTEMVESIKATIPSRSRCWKPTVKQWWVKDDQLDSVLTLCDRHCGGWVNERPQAEPAMPMRLTTELAYGKLWLRAGAPEELIRAAYKCLARLHHPDVTGADDGTMGELNAAYALLSKERV